mgnify:CR=1 FL=1
MKKTAECVIIGGGITGCAVAYFLAKKGMKDVVLLEKDFLAAGATGRCGGGIRQQWSTEYNIKLAMESRKIFDEIQTEWGYDIEWQHGGYLCLAYSDEYEKQFRKNVELQRKLGLKVDLLTPDEAKKLVPQLNVEGVKIATFCDTDGHANPFLATNAFANEAKKLGVEINLFTQVTGIEVKNGRIQKVVTTKGTISTPMVVNASGAYGAQIAKMAGLEIPCTPYRHEILVTEPVNPFFPMMIISFDGNFYFRQANSGGIIGGHGTPGEPPGINYSSSFDFIHAFTNKLAKLMPVLGDVKVIRQWSGMYTVTPDAQPILGGVDELAGYYQAVGYSGHGFMVAPMTAKLLSELILGEELSMSIEGLSLNRFKGTITRETSVV